MSVLLYAENTEGKFKKGVFELVSYAKTIADDCNLEVIAVTFGEISDEELKQLGQYGASRVIRTTNDNLKTFDPQAYTEVLQKLAIKESSQYLIFQNNSNGRALSPRLSVRLKAGLVTGVIGLPQNYSPFRIQKKVYSGKAFADIVVKSETKVLTLFANSHKIEEKAVDTTTEELSIDFNSGLLNIEVKSVERAKGKVPVTEAELIVSAGRGLKGPENWNLVEELAEVLGASTACSKPVADIEWRPHEEHVGQTGKFVSPNLYIAIGISGAIQHLAGISSSKVIVAINNDPEAPIFEAADYGIIGDAFEVVPKLTEAIRKLKNGQKI